MKISKETMLVLKNMSSINNSINIDEVSCLKTVNNSGSIIAIYDTEEEFKKFAIYDMNEFLNIIALFDLSEIDFDFKDDHVKIKSGKNKISYLYTEPDLIPNVDNIKPSDKYKSFSKFDGSFCLSSGEIDKLQRAASIMGLKEMFVTIEDDVCNILLQDDDSDLTNKFNMEVDGVGNVSVNVDVSNFMLIPGDYKISVANNMLLKFEHKDLPIIYFVSARISK